MQPDDKKDDTAPQRDASRLNSANRTPNESDLGTELPQDHATPFSPPSGVQDRIDDTHQVTDSNIDPDERYHKGIEGAAGVDLPGQAADESGDIPEIQES